MPTLNTIKNKQTILLQFLFGGLCLGYFAAQPFNIYTAEIFWLTLALASLIFVILKKAQESTLNTPKELRTLMWLCACFPIVSIISYTFTPLENLAPDRLEPDTRWLLIIPIIIAMRTVQIGPIWVAAFLCTYALSTFLSASIDTHWYTNLYIRANGHENAVPYGMFNATVAALCLVFFASSYIKSLPISKPKVIGLRILALVMTLLATIAAVASGTRAAVLLIPIAIVCIFVLHYPLKKSIPISLALILVLVTAFYLSPPNTLKDRVNVSYDNSLAYFVIGDEKSKSTSIGQRFEQWRESWCIFKIAPLSGSGPRSFKHAHQTYGGPQDCDARQLSSDGFTQAHSLYFNQLSTLGIIGMLIMGAWFFCTAKYAWQKLTNTDHTHQLGANLMLIVIVCFLVNGLTVDLWFKNHVMNKHLLIWSLPLLLMFFKPLKSKNPSTP